MNPDIARTARGFSRGMVVLGGLVLVVCVGFLTAYWWGEGRWLWVVLGIAVIAVNIAMIVMTFRKPRVRRVRSSREGS
ncbi:MAG: hypothetical protein QM673_12955 [Gordonia sp. (in: high G+C Gram-positive bacteria)]